MTARSRRTRQVDAALRRVLRRSRPAPARIVRAMRDCVFPGGKRFRPLLALGGCEAVGAPARQAMAVACAVELIHSYSLVHDDLPAMDNAATRRGLPSCHRRHGEATAILAGDALLTLAFELLGRNPSTRPRGKSRNGASLGIVPSKQRASRDNGTPNSLAIIRTLGQACGVGGLIGGQVRDLETAARGTAVAPRLTRIAREKTAALITASVVAGALAGGAAAGPVRRLARYGRDLGLAFQLIDDVHDGEGLARVLGRTEATAAARRLIRRALRTLEPFGARAVTLRHLASRLSESA